MLQHSPIVYSEPFGAYLVFRYDDVRSVFQDYKTFSSALYDGLSTELTFDNQIQGMDPPRHTQLRALAAHAFTPKAVADLEPRIREIADYLIDAMLAGQDIDFVQQFAVPFPVRVIAEMLGVPEEDFDRFKVWSDIIVEISERLLTGQTEELPEHVAAYKEMKQYFQTMIHQRRAEPRNDLISRLAAAEVDGQQLTDLEAINFCLILLVAGNETTTNLITNLIRTFAEHPKQWKLLRQRRDLIPQAVEEVMRYRTPVQLMFRLVTQETEISGTKLKAGDRVVLYLGAANRDPAKFERPDTFDITRPASPHLTFGHGIHFCLGAPLARLETSIALQVLLDQLDAFEIPPAEALEPLTSFNILGLRKLPIAVKG
ncbi:cytochrome P450 [Paenibacillus caseinilyticus]|uniref:Cytochrome P450 n=1 Tax=Paenibacillus mucilaginosus K02 TaxID=997761 RepID=I0BLS8_9BACL|nr:cytochrome P450 [Paenibacillus mucilaginosus]AFH63325.2 cytochrome P450 [Paenibacillus mucilaginosus K02]